MAAPWERYGGQAAPGIRYIPGPPLDPEEEERRRLTAEATRVNIAQGQGSLGRLSGQVEGDAISNAQGRYKLATEPTYDRFGAMDKMRDAVRQDPRIKSYEMAVPIWASGIQAPESPEGDSLLVNAYAKVMDPLTGVQQGESQAAQGNASTMEQWRARLAKEFGTDGAGNFTPEGRRRMKAAITTRMSSLADAYNAGREEWKGYIRSSGIPDVDPAIVLGRHMGAQFQDEEARYRGRPVDNLDGSIGVVPRMSEEQYRAALNRIFTDPERTPEQRAQAAHQLAAAQGKGLVPEDVQNAAQTGRAALYQPMPKSAPGLPGFGDQLTSATRNTFAGLGQGLAAIPDAATNAFGAVAGAVTDAIPGVPEWVSDNLRRPITIGGTIERLVPTPTDAGGQTARFGAQFAGGIAGLPNRAAAAITNQIVGRVPQRIPLPSQLRPGQQVMQAADDLSAATGVRVDPLAADVSGPLVRRLTSAGAQMPFSAGPIVTGAQRVATQAERALDAVSGRFGATALPDQAGELAKQGGREFVSRTSQRGGDLYKRAEALSGGIRVSPQRAVAVLDEHIQQLSEVPGGAAGLEVLQGLRHELGSGRFSIQGIRGMRTTLRDKFIKDGLRGSDLERRVNDVIEAASGDIVSNLHAEGKAAAAKAYQVADRYWRSRLATIDETLAPVIGRRGEKSGEEVFRAIQGMTRNNASRLGGFIRSLPKEEADTVRATLINQLGRASAGGQNADGTAFSLGQFLTHWNQMTPRAKATVFGSARGSLNNLAKLAEGSKEASRYANTSNTGTPMAALATGGTLAIDWLAPVGAAMAQAGGGRLLASPAFARWLAAPPRSPSQVRAKLGQLSVIANANPAIASEISSVHRQLIQAMNDNFGSITARSAASEPAGDDRRY